MRILIVDDEALNASRLKLVLSKYGACDIESNVGMAIEAFIQSQATDKKIEFVLIEMDKQEMKGGEVAAGIRKWEAANKTPKPATLLMIIANNDLQDLKPNLQALNLNFLVKPYNRKKMELVLKRLGVAKSETPIEGEQTVKVIEAQPKPVPVEPPKDDPKVQTVLKKLTAFVNNAEHFEGVDTRIIFEELVKDGGKQAELLMGQFISNKNLPIPVRIELIRSAGYIRSPLFLVHLNRVVNSEDHIRMVESALIAISKYNDQRALSLLSKALKKLQNPMLLNTIRREMAKIKENNPVLSLLPRFLNSYKSHKNFRVTVEILKKILTPKDTPIFVNYLKAGNQVIEDGAFELLCFSGDVSLKQEIYDYFDTRLMMIACIEEPSCEDVYHVVTYFAAYFDKNPTFLDEKIHNLMRLYDRVNDAMAKQTLLTIFCKCSNEDAMGYLQGVYEEEEEFREWIIEQMAGNPTAVPFLFDKYHKGEGQRGSVIRSLLQSDEGLRYFVGKFFEFDIDKQELIIRNITFRHEDYLLDFLREIYKTQLYSLKIYLLKVIREHFLFSFEDILFHPENEREFMFMGNDYINTIFRLFPITSLMFFLRKIANEDISTTKKKKFLEKIAEVGNAEPVIIFRDIKELYALFERIVKSNNNELNTQFFMAFENIRFLDMDTYKHFMELVNKFVSFRGAMITQAEKSAATKVKMRLVDHFPDIRESQNLEKELKTVFVNQPIVLPQLVKTIKSFPVGIALNFERVASFLAIRFRNAAYVSKDDIDLFNVELPLLGGLIQRIMQKNAESKEDPESEWEKIPAIGPETQKIISGVRVMVNFQSKAITAVFKDQLLEIIPGVHIETDQTIFMDTDILLCDTQCLKEYVANTLKLPKQILLYLENRLDYAAFRAYNPKAFMKPLSGYRVVKMVLKEIFFPL